MPLKCAVCFREFNSIASVADHISDTYKGQQGEVFAGQYTAKELEDPKEMEQFSDTGHGFAHIKYYDKNGNVMTWEEELFLYTALMAGAKWCIDCRAKFGNNYRLYEHIIATGHDSTLRHAAERSLKTFAEFEKKLF